MPNDLIPTSTQATTWTPPQAKAVRWGFNIAIGAVLLTGGAFLVNKFVPNLTLALNNLIDFTQSLMGLAVVGGIAVVLLWLMSEIFSPKGRINKLFAMQYASFINNMTWKMLDLDPLSPFYERQKEVRERKSTLQNASGRVDGIIRRFGDSGDRYAAEAKQHERLAHGAQSQMGSNPRANVAFTTESNAYQKCTEMAQTMYGMRDRLVPIQKQVYALVDAAEVIDKNLDLDIRIAKDKWDANKAVQDVNAAGRAIFRGSDKADLAAQAQQLIDTKYSDQLGALDNLIQTTQPMLDSIDLEKATASEELLAKWQKESTLLISGPTQAPMPILDQSSEFAKLIR